MGAEHARQPVGLERVDGVERLRRRRCREGHELGRAVEPEQRLGDVVRVADARSVAVGRVLALRREQRVREGCRDRPEDEEQRPREEAADPARLHQRRREQHGERLREHVEAADVGELVGDDGVELLPARDAQQPRRDDERGAAGPAADDERTREAVVDQAELRRLRRGAAPRSDRSPSAGGDPRRARTAARPSIPSSARSPSQ